MLQWSRQVGKKSNPRVHVPLHATEHFYIITKDVDGVDSNLPGQHHDYMINVVIFLLDSNLPSQHYDYMINVVIFLLDSNLPGQQYDYMIKFVIFLFTENYLIHILVLKEQNRDIHVLKNLLKIDISFVLIHIHSVKVPVIFWT